MQSDDQGPASREGTDGKHTAGRRGGGEDRADGSGGDGPDAELPSLPVRVARVFVAPGALFEDLRERPVWLDVLLVSIAVSLLVGFLLPEDVMRDAMLQQMPSDASEGDVETALQFAEVVRYLGAVLGPPLIALVLGAVLTFVFDLILGGNVGFRRYFSVSCHAGLIQTAGGLVMLPLIVATADVQTALALHLLVPGLEEGFVVRFLRGLNVFGLWTAVVLGVAVGQLHDDRTAAGAAGVLLGLYVITKAAMAGIGA